MTLYTLQEASKYASNLTGKDITEANILYLIQYGHLDKYRQDDHTCVSEAQLKEYYTARNTKKQHDRQFITNVNWELAFDDLKESESTKHVHRLHPYKGKYIPQLVAYFLDEHTDNCKKEVYFHEGDIVLDPFSGSGTTLVQANELGLHAIGLDISVFNTQIANSKLGRYDYIALESCVTNITDKLTQYEAELGIKAFETELSKKISKFNSKYFPTSEYRKQVKTKELDEKTYGKEKEQEFQAVFNDLLRVYDIDMGQDINTFLGTWYFSSVRKEIEYVNSLIQEISDSDVKSLLQIVLSRTMRSCRATTHTALATLQTPIYRPYYCRKHKKICKPLFSILKWWSTYTKDTLIRLHEFDTVRTDTVQKCFTADSTTVDITGCIQQLGKPLMDIYNKQKIRGIFCSPPYVGLIDYHEQHAYAYELFGLERHDTSEIGALSSGATLVARKTYVDSMVKVLINCKKYLAPDYSIFVVANDRYGLYDEIAEKAGMTIVERFTRPVLNRAEGDTRMYTETIFRLKETECI